MSATRSAQNNAGSTQGGTSSPASTPGSSPIRNAVSSSPERAYEHEDEQQSGSSPIRPGTPTATPSGAPLSTLTLSTSPSALGGSPEHARERNAGAPVRPGTPVERPEDLNGPGGYLSAGSSASLGLNGHVDGSPTANGSSSPMELVDEDLTGALELEGGEEYIGDEFLQDLRRVKVYELVGQNWNDLGTAFCSGEYDEALREAQLIAKSEETQEVLLQITIRADDVYQRQAETLIVWTELNGKDYALSFQDVEGCTEVWEFILEVRRHIRSTHEPPPPVINPNLPAPSINNLSEIDKQIRAVHRAGPIRTRLAESVISTDLVRKLIALKNDAEDLHDLESLQAICSIMQAVLLLNDHTIYEYVLRDDIFMDMIGLMEYDPEFPRLKANYRDFLVENAKHHQVVEFRDPAIRAKVHHTYRLQYLKDVVLARALDDVIFNSISSTIIFNQIEIVTYIQNEEYFLRELFSIFVQHPALPSGPMEPSVKITTGPDVEPANTQVTTITAPTEGQEVHTGAVEKIQVYTEDRRAPALLLLHQFCTMGKSGQVPFRLALFRALVDRGVLYPVQWALSQHDGRLLNTAAEVLAMVLDHDAGGVRGHILRQVEEESRREGGDGATGSPEASTSATNGATGSLAYVPTGSTIVTGQSHPPTLLSLMSSILTSSQHELSLKSQLADSYRTLMEVHGLEATVPGMNMKLMPPIMRKEEQQSDAFLDYFYKKCARALYAPLLDNVPEHKNVLSTHLELTRAQSDLYLYLCDLLCGFLFQHSYQSHFFVLGNNFAPRIASLLFAREKHLRLAALRFFRMCLRLNNRNLLTNLMKHDVFSPILRLTERESARDNLLTSCCQEFFEHLRRDNLKEVIDHIMKGHEELVRKLVKSPIVGERFAELIRRWEQNNEPPPPAQAPQPIPIQRRWVAARIVDAEEEYFNAEDDDSGPGTRTRGQARRRAGAPGVASNTPGKRTTRPTNVALPRNLPISGAPLVDYQEDDETADANTSPPTATAAAETTPVTREGSTRLRGRPRRPDLSRTPSSSNLDPNRLLEQVQAGLSTVGASTSSLNEPQLRSLSPSGRHNSPAGTIAMAMDEDEDLIGPPVHLSGKRRRELEEDDEGLERLAKRPALRTASTPTPSPTAPATMDKDENGSSPAVLRQLQMESEEMASPSPSPEPVTRGKKRQLRVKLAESALAAQPPDVKVGDKG